MSSSINSSDSDRELVKRNTTTNCQSDHVQNSTHITNGPIPIFTVDLPPTLDVHAISSNDNIHNPGLHARFYTEGEGPPIKKIMPARDQGFMTADSDLDAIPPPKRMLHPNKEKQAMNLAMSRRGRGLDGQSLLGMQRNDSVSSSIFVDDSSPWSESTEAKGQLIALLSALYAVVLIILAIAFELSPWISDQIGHGKYEPFYIYLYGMGLLYLAYCSLFILRRDTGWPIPLPFSRLSSRNLKGLAGSKSVDSSPGEEIPVTTVPSCRGRSVTLNRNASHSGPTAGSLYLRLGCVAFGLIGMIYQGLSFVQEHQLGQLDGIVVTGRTLNFFFIFFQTYFIFENSKMVVHRFKQVAWFGTMHLVATNVCVWIRFVINEEREMMHNIEMIKNDNFSSSNKIVHDSKEHISAEPIHKVLHKLTTKNFVHKKISQVDNDIHKRVIRDIMSSSVHQQGHEEAALFLPHDFRPFLTTSIIEYSIICAAVMYILWRNIGRIPPLERYAKRKHNFKVDCSSSSKGLFMGLLFFVITIVSVVIFFVKVHVHQDVHALWIFHISDSVHYVVSVFVCIWGFCRMRGLSYLPMRLDMLLLDDILLYVGLFGQLMFCIFNMVPMNVLDKFTEIGSSEKGIGATVLIVSLLRMIQVLVQTVFILTAQRLCIRRQIISQGEAHPESVPKPGREFVTFLLVVNLALFLINIFEANKASQNLLMLKFYDRTAWSVIVSSTVPLCIFYRFHSSVCLAEIWKSAYKLPVLD